MYHPINLGQGAALATGITYALRAGAKMIVTFDADGQHRVEDAVLMLEVANETASDVVLGSRFLGQAVGISEKKKFFLKAATMFTRWTSGLAITDTHNGLRCLTAKAARAIKIRHNRMAHASEILNQIGGLGLKYVEVPCVITYSEYSVAKGQRMSGAINILTDLAIRKLYK
jgi:glycosyltransferase involved in cell wall biosynthesis